MLTPSVIEIKNKAGKKNFDQIQLVKVVAYLDDKSKGKTTILSLLLFHLDIVRTFCNLIPIKYNIIMIKDFVEVKH